MDTREKKLEDLRLTKGTLLRNSDNYEEFFDLIEQAEYELAQLQKAEQLIKQHKERSDLVNRFYSFKNEYNKESTKRSWLTYAGFAVACLVVLFITIKTVALKNADFWELCSTFAVLIIPSCIIAGIHFFINFSVFDHLFKKDQEAYNHLLRIDEQIKKIEKEINGELCPTPQELASYELQFLRTKRRLEEF